MFASFWIYENYKWPNIAHAYFNLIFSSTVYVYLDTIR